jgi:hypothetical protein
MFSHRFDFSRRFQKSTPKMANLAFVRKANSALNPPIDFVKKFKTINIFFLHVP